MHAGQHLDEVFGAVVPPIHLSSTYAPTAVGELRRGYDYGRGTNPTRDALQEQLAALEAGVDESGAPRATGLTFASGLAAETALIMGAGRPGMTIVLGNDVYGGSYRLISRVLAPWGVEHVVVDMGDAEQVAAAVERAAALAAALGDRRKTPGMEATGWRSSAPSWTISGQIRSDGVSTVSATSRRTQGDVRRRRGRARGKGAG